MLPNILLRYTLALLIVGSSAVLAAQINYSLLVPDIPGENLRSPYEDQIEITSFSYGLEAESGTGRTGGSVTQGCFLLGKLIDRASPRLFAAVTQGRRFDEITLTVYDNGSTAGGLLIYTFSDVTITKFETGADSSVGVEEVIALQPRVVTIAYNYYGSDGSLIETLTETYDFSPTE